MSKPLTRKRWYGWQTLLVDGASISLIVASGATDVKAGLVTGGLGYFFGPGMVHLAHRNTGEGFASMGIRAGLGVITYIGVLECVGDIWDEDSSTSGGCFLGTLGFIGLIAAVPFDAIALAYEVVPTEEGSAGPFRNLVVRPFFEPVWSAHTRQRQWTTLAHAPPDGAVAGFRAGLGVHGTF